MEQPGVLVVGKINASQDGVIVLLDGCAPCLSAGHANCPKVIWYEEDCSDRD